MKKCFYFPTFEEELDFVISNDANYIAIRFRGYNSALDKIGLLFDEVRHKSRPSDPIKQTLSKLTGAKWYGDYVVFSFFKFDNMVDNLNQLQEKAVEYCKQYSLHLQGKENQWEEIKKILDI